MDDVVAVVGVLCDRVVEEVEPRQVTTVGEVVELLQAGQTITEKD